MKLTSDAVSTIFSDCLFTDEEVAAGGDALNAAIRVEGITQKFGLHPERTRSHQGEIIALLAQLPDEFQASKGGGMSFLNMCQNREGEQWTEFHKVMQELVVLGIAIEKVSYPLPRAFWGALPGSVPYIMVQD